MSITYYLKIRAYWFFNTALGKSILKLLSGFVYVKGLSEGLSKSIVNIRNKLPFIISITIDAESGYVKKNDHRVWQKSDPNAYIGFYKGIENWRALLNKHNSKATFFLSTNCFNAKGEEYKKIIQQLKLLLKEGHEIGLHMHPDSDLALQASLGRRFHSTSAKFFSSEEISELIAEGKRLIKRHLGIDAVSFRWGNWALSTDAVSALEKNGFKIDSSATPGIKGHQHSGMSYDWSNVAFHYPWKLSIIDYQNTSHQNSSVLEIPIATFNFLGLGLRADPANSALLSASFEHYYKNADRSKKKFIFVVISHSIESAYEDGSPAKVVGVMEEFIIHSKKHSDVKFMGLADAYRLIS